MLKPASSYDYSVYYFFYLLAFLAVVFIIGVILSLKYTSYRKHIGRIFVAVGIIEILPYIAVIITRYNLYSLSFLLFNPSTFLLILGCITLASGVAIFKQAKRLWMLLLIIAATILILWTFSVFFM